MYAKCAVAVKNTDCTVNFVQTQRHNISLPGASERTFRILVSYRY